MEKIFLIIRIILNFIVFFIFGILTLGLWLLYPIRKILERKARVLYEPTKSEFSYLLEFYAKSVTIFKINSLDEMKAKYSNYTDYFFLEIDNVRVCVYENSENKTQDIIIRGSANKDNWITNFTMFLNKHREMNIKLHAGYLETSTKIVNYLIENNIIKKEYELTISGNSLGGALAVALGWILDYKKFKVKQIYSFASPKITINDYSHLNVTTVLNIQDPIPFLPIFSNFRFYRHQDDRIVIIPNIFNDRVFWYRYKDNIYSDILLSIFFLPRYLNPSTHTKYYRYFVKKYSEIRN